MEALVLDQAGGVREEPRGPAEVDVAPLALVDCPTLQGRREPAGVDALPKAGWVSPASGPQILQEFEKANCTVGRSTQNGGKSKVHQRVCNGRLLPVLGL